MFYLISIYLLFFSPNFFLLSNYNNLYNSKVSESCCEITTNDDELYGFDLKNHFILDGKIKRNDTFVTLLLRYGFGYEEAYSIAEKLRKQNNVNLRRFQIGKKIKVLYDLKCTPNTPVAIVYAPNLLEYSLFNLRDSIYANKVEKPIKLVEKESVGVVQSSLYQTIIDNGYPLDLMYQLSDVYAWTIDFTRLQKGDNFKVIYTEKFVDDSISIGVDDIKAAYFEHKGQPQFAFKFITDSVKGIVDYYDEKGKNLRRAFLKAPLAFSRISSRYNLKRKIAYYGRVKPHRGTDFAAPVGAPILATANGTVIKSSYKKGNGNYVKIKHNNIYSTQYLHMKKRNVKVGEFVRQGQVIGWVGMTGNTSGPHVCYRFWKYGKQVDPFRQKLPEAKQMDDIYKQKYFPHIMETHKQLVCIPLIENL